MHIFFPSFKTTMELFKGRWYRCGSNSQSPEIVDRGTLLLPSPTPNGRVRIFDVYSTSTFDVFSTSILRRFRPFFDGFRKSWKKFQSLTSKTRRKTVENPSKNGRKFAKKFLKIKRRKTVENVLKSTSNTRRSSTHKDGERRRRFDVESTCNVCLGKRTFEANI